MTIATGPVPAPVSALPHMYNDASYNTLVCMSQSWTKFMNQVDQHHRCGLQSGFAPSSNPQALMHGSSSIRLQACCAAAQLWPFCLQSCTLFLHALQLSSELQSSMQENAAALFHRSRASDFANVEAQLLWYRPAAFKVPW